MFSPTEIFVMVFAGIGLASLAEGVWQHFKPKPPPPPPRKWKVNFHAPDGYPMRDYSLNEKQIAKVMAMIHQELDNPSEGRTN